MPVENAVPSLSGKEKFIKWALALVAIAFILNWVGPMIIGGVIKGIQLVILGIVLAAVLYFIPAITEILASTGYRAWEAAIQADPLSRLKRDLEVQRKVVDDSNNAIAEGRSGVAEFRRMIAESKGSISEDRVVDWQEKAKLLDEGVELMVQSRNNALADLKEGEKLYKEASIEYKLGTVFAQQVQANALGKKVGTKSGGWEVAIQTCRDKLNKSSNALRVVMESKKTELALSSSKG